MRNHDTIKHFIRSAHRKGHHESHIRRFLRHKGYPEHLFDEVVSERPLSEHIHLIISLVIIALIGTLGMLQAPSILRPLQEIPSQVTIESAEPAIDTPGIIEPDREPEIEPVRDEAESNTTQETEPEEPDEEETLEPPRTWGSGGSRGGSSPSEPEPIEEPEPSITNVVLASETQSNLSNESLTVTYTPNYAEDYRFDTDWRVNGTSIAVVSYPFNDDSLHDRTTFERHAAANGSISWNETCSCLDVSEGHLDLPTIPLANTSLTIALSLHPTGSGTVFAAEPEVGETLTVRMNQTGELRFGIDGNETAINGLIGLDQWHHLVLVYDHDRQERIVYHNGTRITIESAEPFIGADPKVTLGSRSGDPHNYSGSIGSFAIYDRALNETQIARLYEAYGSHEPVLEMASEETDPGDVWSVRVYATNGSTTVFNDSNSVVINETYEPVTIMIGPRIVESGNLSDATHFVSPQGEGTSCTQEEPCTLQTALIGAEPGRHIFLRSGTYTLTNQLSITASGTSYEPIVIESYPEERAVIDGEYNPDTRIAIWNDHLVIRNINITRMAGSAGLYIEGNHNLIEGVNSYANHYSGIQVFSPYEEYPYGSSGSNNTIRDCISHSNSDADLPSQGEFANGISISSGDRNRVLNCLSYNNSDDGIDSWRATNTLIAFSISHSNGAGIHGDGNGIKAGGIAPSNNTIVIHTLSYHNRARGFDYNGGGNVSFLYVTSYDNDRSFWTGDDTIVESSIAFGDGADPNFGSGTMVNNSWQESEEITFLSTDPNSEDFLKPPPGSVFEAMGAYAHGPYATNLPEVSI